jgi:predicted Zn finger-like uncharacterized protein
MSLATRCGTCGTIFRVVHDQLKVSEGWVRCGRCGEVFNALQALFDLEREAPPPFPAGGRPDEGDAVPTRNTPLAPADPREVDPPPVPARVASPEPPPAAVTPAAPAAPAARVIAPAAPAMPEPDAPVAQPAWREPLESDLADAMPSTASILDTRAEPGFDPTRQEDALTRVDDPIDADRLAWAQAGAGDPVPGFLRDDVPGAGSTPLARAAWGFLALLLTLGLVAQVAVHRRDAVAQAWPWSRPMLAQWCAVSGCELLEAPRRLEVFTVETSSLTRKNASGEAYRLSVTLRNRGAQPALMPSIDLALKDGSGQLVARRALHPADFRIGRPVVAAGADATLQLVMTAAKGQVSGYTIEIFYP